MSLGVFIGVRGREEANAALQERADRANDLTGAWDILLPQMRQRERVLFATRGHGTWPANRPGTVRQKGRNTPLIDKGRLFAALTTPRARGSVTRRSRTQLLFGVNDNSLFYSRFVGKKRPFIISEREARTIGAKAVNDWLSGGR